MLWSLAVWPLWETTPELLALDERKNNAYLAWARHASHHVERVDVPFGDSTFGGVDFFPQNNGLEQASLLSRSTSVLYTCHRSPDIIENTIWPFSVFLTLSR